MFGNGLSIPKVETLNVVPQSHTNQKIDPLKYFLSKSTLTDKLEKWVMVLSEFDIEYVDLKSIKGQVIVDAPLLVEQPIYVEILNAKIMQVSTQSWKLYLIFHLLKVARGKRYYLLHHKDA